MLMMNKMNNWRETDYTITDSQVELLCEALSLNKTIVEFSFDRLFIDMGNENESDYDGIVDFTQG